MTKIYKLKNQIKHYEWGSTHLLPDFLGIKNKKKLPFAEMWLGTHNNAPSMTELDGKQVFLSELSGELPFLFKLLAVKKPLSIQAHPNKEKAENGFLREEKEGIAMDNPKRSYKDTNKKDELICAITPFTLMAGFKKPEELFNVSDDQRKMIDKISKNYPKDAGVFSPVYMNLITLKPGEAIFIPSGTIHSYINGFALELMNSSDNVLRGGLTSKHVDISELIKITNNEPFLPQIITPVLQENFCYPLPVNDFSLSVLQSKGGEILVNQKKCAICIVTEGEVITSGFTFTKGDSFFVPQGSGLKLSELKLNGTFTIYMASS